MSGRLGLAHGELLRAVAQLETAAQEVGDYPPGQRNEFARELTDLGTRIEHVRLQVLEAESPGPTEDRRG